MAETTQRALTILFSAFNTSLLHLRPLYHGRLPASSPITPTASPSPTTSTT